VVRLTDQDESSICSRLDQIREDIRRQPTEHGWEKSGALSAYADEDPYIENNALSWKAGSEIRLLFSNFTIFRLLSHTAP
jgi:hypothetical protein